MTRAAVRAALTLVCAAGIAAPGATAVAKEPAPKRLPFAEDRLPPIALPTPLDRHLKGELLEFDGTRARVRWDWSHPAQLEDFDPFVPVRATVHGAFTWKEGLLEARGTAGLRLRLGFLDDLELRVPATLHDPHDLGVVLPRPDSSDESVLCLVQDRFFTRFDKAAGNTNMINKMGGIPATAPGHVEFRYVDRKPQPKLDPGAEVTFTVSRAAATTTFVIGTADGREHELSGKDTDTAYLNFTPGLYVAGASADFGALEIEGRLDPVWLNENRVLPQVAADLLHPGNRFKGSDRAAALLVERFVDPERRDTGGKKGKKPKKPAAPPEPVKAEQIVKIVGDTSAPLVVRIRAAEALTQRGVGGGRVAERIAALLDSAEGEARQLAWQVLAPQLPWHFDYEPDGDPAARREAALLVADYFRQRDYELAEGKVFVEGYWYSAARADAHRETWEKAWELRTPRIRLRTNLPRAWALWYLAALEAQYRELVRFAGREPPRSELPLSVFVFRSKEHYKTFCEENGYADRAAWGRFADLDKRICCVAFTKRAAPLWALNQNAKVFQRAATGKVWPTWFAEGRAAWFGNAQYHTATWDGTTLKVGITGHGVEPRRLLERVNEGVLWSAAEFLDRDVRVLEDHERRIWYVHAWALHHWLLTEAPDDLQRRFAAWQGVMENLATTPRTVDQVGREQFLLHFRGRLDELDAAFAEWVRTLH